MITRTIVPFVSQPQLAPGGSRTNGIGDSTVQLFFSPAKPEGVIWGVGPVVYLPTATDDKLGTDQWGLGPTAVVLKMDGPWVYGGVGQHLWSVGGSSKGDLTAWGA